jgi:transcriptional regulator with XRE-family HTH domain
MAGKVRNTRTKQHVRRLREGRGGGRHRTPEGAGQDMAREGTRTADGPLARFSGTLKRLQQDSGLTQASLAGAVKVSTSQMSDILNGRIVKAPGWDVVRSVVRACLAHAEKTSRPGPPDLCDEEDWRRRHFDLEHDLEAEPHLIEAAQPVRARAGILDGAVGWLIGDLTDPFALEVHRPIEIAEPPAADLPSLPLYVPREHDRRLAVVVARAEAGNSVIGVLVGGSSTGKTRAC